MASDSRDRAARARSSLVIMLVAMVGLIGLLSMTAGADTSSSPDTNTRADWSPATVDATHGMSAPATLTGAVEGRTMKIHIDGPTGKVHGATARMCRSGLDVQFTADMSPTSSGDCTPQAFQAGQDDNQVTATADSPMTNIDFQFRVGSGTQTFTYSGGSSTITCDDTHPCAVWIWEQVDSTITSDNSGNVFKHFDIQYGAAGTTTTTGGTTTTTAGTTTTTGGTTTTTAGTTTTTGGTTTTTGGTTTTTAGTTTTTGGTTTTTAGTTTTTGGTTTTTGGTTTTTAAPPPPGSAREIRCEILSREISILQQILHDNPSLPPAAQRFLTRWLAHLERQAARAHCTAPTAQAARAHSARSLPPTPTAQAATPSPTAQAVPVRFALFFSAFRFRW